MSKAVKFFVRASFAVFLPAVLPLPGYGQCGSVPVTNTGDSGPGSLRAAVLAACPGGTIDLTSLAGQTITLQSRLYISQDLTIQGPANETVTIDGGSATRLFFIQSGNVTITNLILAHGLGRGGASGLGGGAAGMGGAIFQNAGNLTLTNVGFSGNQAIGGSINNSSNSAGGGGFGGSAPAGGVGGSGGDLGGAGGSVDGSNGGPGAGGGGGLDSATGGAGGFGGGGGYSPNVGGAGGFGGGGGSGGAHGSTGGFGGGTGATSANNPHGGGGAAFGGAIFEFSGTLTLNSVTFSANTPTGGSGNQNGQAKGGALFVYYGATANLNNVTFSGDAAADAGQPAIGNSSAPYTNGSVCPGFDTSDICGLVSFGFGSVNIGQTVTQTIPFNLTLLGTSTTPVVLTAGSPNLDYKLVGTNCPATVAALPLLCTVTVSFTPQYAGERPGAVYLANSTGPVSSTALLNGIGIGPQIAFGPGVQSTLSAAFSGPVGVAVDGAGDVFVADTNSGIIYELPAGGAPPNAIVSAIAGLAGLALDAAGNIFYTIGAAVYELKQPYTSTPVAVGRGFGSSQGVAVDASGNVFVADPDFHQVVEIPATGAPQTTVGSGFSVPLAVAVDAAGNIYVDDAGPGRVYKVPADGSAQTTVGSGFDGPAIALNAAGDLYVADVSGHIYKVPADGSPQITLSSGFSSPRALAVNAAGDLFITDLSTHATYEITFSQPPALTFSNTNVTSTSTAQSVTIENIGNANLVESALTIDTNFKQVAGSGTPADCTASTTLAQGASCNLSISFAPTTGGPLTGSAQLTNNSLNQGPAKQSISLSGTGVAVPSTLSVTVAPNGSFTQGQTAEWDVQVYNVAASATDATSGTTTLVDTLPTGFTLSSFVGAGWTCNVVTTTITCMSSQVVAGASGAFAKLHLIVNVPAASALNVTDHVSVYGGGDPNHTSLGTAATAFSTVNVVQAPGSITVTGGNNQSTAVNTQFPTFLSVVVKDGSGDVIAGATVTFTSPSTGASGTFSNSTNTTTATTSANGSASVPFTANANGGGPYNVTSAVNSLSTSFALTNTFLSQTIQNFGTIPTQTVGTPLTLSATATSNLPVSYSSATTQTVCTVALNTITFLMPGQCSITASQTGNGTYAAANSVNQSFQVVGGTPFITGQTPGPLRNNYTGFVGLELTVGTTPVTVYSLGRFIASGNTQAHLLKLVQANGTDVPNASVSLATSGATAGQFAYAPLASSVTLLANTSYFLVSQETADGDQWYDYGAVATAPIATVVGPAYVDQMRHYIAVTTLPARSYVPVSFLYAPPTTALSVSITSPAPSATISGTASITVSTTGPVTSLQVQVDGVNQGSPVAVSVNQGPSYTLSLDTTVLKIGSHLLTVVANGTAASPSVSVTVSNAPGGSTAFVLGQTPGSLRNNYSGFVGMSLKVGSTPVVVASLGRFAAPGNTGTHLVKLVNSNGTDVPGGSVSISMSGSTPGTFQYASLPAGPFTLQANTTYYLVSQETSGGDYWYDYGAVSTSVIASVVGPAYTDSFGNYVTVGGLGGDSYVPVSFLYGPTANTLSANITSPQNAQLLSGTVQVQVNTTGTVTSYQLQVDGVNAGAAVSSSPIPLDTTQLSNGQHTLSVMVSGNSASAESPGIIVTINNIAASDTAFTTSQSARTLRNNYSGFVGMQIAVGGTPLNLVSLGRYIVAGNSGPHLLKLVQANGTDVPGGSVKVNTSGSAAGQFMYAALPATITLSANTTYYLVSQEVAGGDMWYDLEPITTTGVAHVTGPTYTDGNGNYVTVSGFAGYGYVPLSFQYQ